MELTNNEEEILRQVWSKLKDPGERRYRECNLFHCNDILFSRDLFILDIINQNKDSIKDEDYKMYIDWILSIINNPKNSPTHGCRVSFNNQLEIFSYDEQVGIHSIEQFVHGKRNSFILHNVALDLLEHYPNLWKTTRHTRPNLAIKDILSNYNAFIILDNHWHDMDVLGTIINLNEYASKFINIRDLDKWFTKYTKNKEELYINWYNDTPMGVEDILDRLDRELEEDIKNMMFIKTIIIPMNLNSMDYYKFIKEDKSRQLFATLIYQTYGTLAGIQGLR